MSLGDKVREIVTPYLCAGSIKVIKGKMVLDVYPAVAVNKGTAAECLLSRFLLRARLTRFPWSMSATMLPMRMFFVR
jgi:lysozyme family protein